MTTLYFTSRYLTSYKKRRNLIILNQEASNVHFSIRIDFKILLKFTFNSKLTDNENLFIWNTLASFSFRTYDEQQQTAYLPERSPIRLVIWFPQVKVYFSQIITSSIHVIKYHFQREDTVTNALIYKLRMLSTSLSNNNIVTSLTDGLL